MTQQDRPRLPRAVWALGFVSLLMDISSEMIHSLLPVFLVTTLGASMLVVGLVDGVAEATALIVRVFSGTLSDWMGRRKPLAVLGYGLGAVSKPLFALAGSPALVLGARMLDRVGKGIRAAPRDALVADITPDSQRGAAFGLRQALDSVGSFMGPLLAIALMLLWANDFRAVFWVAVIPGFLCVLLLVVGVQEPDTPPGRQRINPLSRDSLRQLTPAYWRVVILGAVFTLARFSEAFLVLRAQQGALPVAYAPLVLIAMNVVYALGAYPLGALADRMDHRHLLGLGLLLLVAADLLLAASGSGPVLWAGILLWGVHMAMTQGLLAAMVADTAPPTLRGTAYGVFNLAAGITTLAASVIAGLLWDHWGPATTFAVGAALAAAALALVVLQRRRAA